MFGGLGACPWKFLQNMTSILDDLVQFGWEYGCCIKLYPTPGGKLKKIKCDFLSMQFPANVSDDQRAIQALLVISELEIVFERRGQVLVSFRRLRKILRGPSTL